MSSCKECIHYGMCLEAFRRNQVSKLYEDMSEREYFSTQADKCKFFADSNLYLKAPCRKGTVLYRVTYPYRSEPKVTEFVVVGFATMGKKHQEVYVQVRVNGVQGVNVMRFRQFHFNREDAEKELQEVLNGKSH